MAAVRRSSVVGAKARFDASACSLVPKVRREICYLVPPPLLSRIQTAVNTHPSTHNLPNRASTGKRARPPLNQLTLQILFIWKFLQGSDTHQ